ncbi:MAG: restriction endonuclease subunit S [Campylobacter sp.]|nr:restriction endonuclease subunit S [Campylobacter sp.]MBR7046843.1 restriction endonuclease subunit S [Campylobacter sp.]
MNEDKIGVPIYRMNEIENMICKSEVSKYAEITNEEFNTFKLNDGDVLFNRTNSYEFVGRTGIFYKQDKDFVFASYLVRLVVDKKIILPEYLTVFLNTKIGQNEIKRRARQSINQTNVNPEEVKQIKIPIFPLEFQQQIEQMVRQSHECLEQSKDLYREAEILLYQELGLNPQNPLATIAPVSQSLNFSVRTLKESLHTTGRLDSEYYQIKYDEIEKVIKNYRGGYFQISQSEIKDKNFNPQTDKQYRYIELANIGANGNISEPIIDFGENLPSRARRLVKTGDMIMSSVEGSLQSCALITDEFDDCIVSTGFYVLNSVNLNSETLLVLFKSAFFQEYLHKFPSGTILTAISKDELRNIIIPKINLQIQTQIAEKIKQSFALRVKANELLQSAKTKVETAIEQA